MKAGLLVCVLILFASVSIAQSIVSGKVFELQTKTALPGIKITARSSGESVQSDTSGGFFIRSRVGDLLIFSGAAYESDTLLVIDEKPLQVFLTRRTHLLKEVAITSAQANLGEFRDPQYHGQTMAYQVDKDGVPIGGVIFRISYWNKDSKRKRRSQKRLALAQQQSEVYDLFDPANVRRYIPLKGQQLQEFIELYRPSVTAYKAPAFDLLVYLNQKYKEYLGLPAEKKRLAPLKN